MADLSLTAVNCFCFNLHCDLSSLYQCMIFPPQCLMHPCFIILSPPTCVVILQLIASCRKHHRFLPYLFLVILLYLVVFYMFWNRPRSQTEEKMCCGDMAVMKCTAVALWACVGQHLERDFSLDLSSWQKRGRPVCPHCHLPRTGVWEREMSACV